MKNFIPILLAGLCQISIANAQESPVYSYSQKLLFKNWTLSRCLEKAYPVEASKQDAQASAGAYLEFGKAPIEAYEKAEVLVAQYLSRNYHGSVKSEFNTMKCIDLFHSNEMESLAQQSSKKK